MSVCTEPHSKVRCVMSIGGVLPVQDGMSIIGYGDLAEIVADAAAAVLKDDEESMIIIILCDETRTAVSPL